MAGHDIDLVTLDLARKRRLRLHRHDTRAQLRGHALRVIFVQTQLLPDLLIGKVQAHQVQAQDPYPQRLVVTRKDRPSQVVKVAAASRAAIFSAQRLGRVMPLPGHFGRRTMRAAHPLRPASFAYFVVTLGIVQQVLKVEHRANILKASQPKILSEWWPASAQIFNRPKHIKSLSYWNCACS